MPDFDKLAKHADKLSALLKDRQPGLTSWSMSVGYYWNKICRTVGPVPNDNRPDFTTATHPKG
ncbi:hypothetical protein LCGC14_1334940 [marine sediment metagenome]|uniref:Uncharacterized protein n=1 Tax=marine sediment metagenome TaxID=412755 RepID=A0A0F9MWC2_9ZZZZ|nr:hypothetical protein [Pricia sp.]